MTPMKVYKKQKQTHRYREQTSGWQGGREVGRGIEKELGSSRCKLLNVEWVNNKVLLYGRGSYIQYPVINHMEKNIKKNGNIYIHLQCRRPLFDSWIRKIPWRKDIGYPLQYSWASLVAQMVRICLQCRRTGFNPWVEKIPWRRAWQPTPVFLSGESPWTE